MLTIMLGFASLLSACALGFVLGRIWEIREEMRLTAAGHAGRPRGPELRVTTRQEQSGITSEMQLWGGKALLLFRPWAPWAKCYLKMLCVRLLKALRVSSLLAGASKLGTWAHERSGGQVSRWRLVDKSRMTAR